MNKKDCKSCESYGILNDRLGERCIIKGIQEFPSGFKMSTGCVRAYPIPKERTCKNFKERIKTSPHHRSKEK